MKHSIDVGAGVIDSDYRGDVRVLLFNHSDKDFKIQPNDRIAQIIFERIVLPKVILSQKNKTCIESKGKVRGKNGFGSTGK